MGVFPSATFSFDTSQFYFSAIHKQISSIAEWLQFLYHYSRYSIYKLSSFNRHYLNYEIRE